MDTPENTLTCDALFDLTAGGLEDLDELTLARCREHAKTCEDCRLHLEGVAAWDDAIANPGKYPRTKPEVRDKILRLAREHAPGEAKGPRALSIFPFLLVLAVAGAATLLVFHSQRP